MMAVGPKNIDVVILCGGLGERIRSILSDRPKPMAEVNGRAFLDILIDYTAAFGFRRFILCIGYMGNVIKHHYQIRESSVEILFSEEVCPLGTAGAIKNAESIIESSPFLVMNGDSFCHADMKDFLEFHLSKNALLSIAVTNAKKRDDYGFVRLKDSLQIAGFDEKTRGRHGDFVNAGIYLFQRRALSLIPGGQNFSLEKDFFPKFVHKESAYGYIAQGFFIDIGTPDGYEEARQILKKRPINIAK